MRPYHKAPVIQNRSILISYVRLGRLLHWMAIAEILLICFLFDYFDLIRWACSGNVFYKTLGIITLIFPPIYPILDARSRFQNYKQVKDVLYQYGFQERLIRPFISSRCQRDAVMTAAEELGYQQECKAYFYRSGYRFYHLFPDFMFTRPSYLFSSGFWWNTFWVKHYEPKFDFWALASQSSSGSASISCKTTVSG